MSGSNLDQLYADANTQINSLLSAKKTKYIVIRPGHLRADLTEWSILKYKWHNVRANWKNCNENATKFLGIYLDEHLTWNHHDVTQLNKKVSRALFSIKLPIDCLKHCTIH